MIVVFSRPGREALTAATVAKLEGYGGGHLVPNDRKLVFWVGETPPPVVPWQVMAFPQKPGGNVADYWMLLRAFPGVDLVTIEDDVHPCKNAVAAMDAADVDHLTTYYNPRNFREGLRQIDASGFNYAQAIKLPAALVDRLRREHPSSVMPPCPPFYDNVIGAFLTRWSLPFFQSRSLVEHAGRVSVARPGALRAHAAVDFDPAFDAIAGTAADPNRLSPRSGTIDPD